MNSEAAGLGLRSEPSPSVSRERLRRLYREAVPEDRPDRGLESDFLWSLIQLSPGAFIVLDTELRIVLWSRGAEKMFGWTEEEVVGRRPPMIPEDEEGAFREMAAEVLEGERLRGREVRRRHRDGSLVTCQKWSRALRTADGEVLGVRTFCLDIGEWKEAERHRFLFEQNVAGVARASLDGELIDCNPAFARMFGHETVEEALERSIDDYYPDDCGPGNDPVRRALREEGKVRNAEARRVTREGRELRLLTNARVVEDPERGEPTVLATWIDVTERREAQRRYRELFEHNVAGVFRATPEGTILECNQALADMLGYDSPADLEGTEAEALYPTAADRQAYLERLRASGEVVNEELQLQRRDGSPVWVLENAILGEDPGTSEPVIQGTLVNITERKKLEEQLRHQALHDPLTGLANRTLLSDRVEQSLAGTARRRELVCLLMIDIDYFQRINESLGRAAGDRVLAELARRVQEAVRGEDTVARWGGDEFVVFLPGLEEPAAIEPVVDRIRTALQRPIEVGEQSLRLDVSVGAVIHGADDGSPTVRAQASEDLVRFSHRALRRAKEAPGSTFHLFRPEEEAERAGEVDLEQELRRGLKKGQVIPYYQPIVRLDDGSLEGFEVLARWEHPDRGLVPPAEFIPVAEDYGLISELGRAVVRKGLARAPECARAAPGELTPTFWFNLSAQQFRDPELTGQLESQLEEAGLGADRIALEVTETSLMQATAQASDLRDLGARLYVDDFGTGHSTFAYLRDLELDGLKIDMSFVQRITESEADAALLGTMLNLGEQMDLTVVAEGIETKEQRDRLRTMGCQLGQGFFFARPMPPEGCAEWFSSV